MRRAVGYYAQITKRVQQLKKRYGTRDPFEIARQCGIHILYSDQFNRLKGMYRVIARNRFIILNNHNTPQMNRIVCAHELGHDQLHRKFAASASLQEFALYDMSSAHEYEANLFAADLLLDETELCEYVQAGYDTVQIAGIMQSDINLVALKLDCMIRDGYAFRPQMHNTRFLK